MLKQRKLVSVLFVVSVVAACAPPATVEFNGHSVTVRTATPQASDREAATVEAKRVCGKVGKTAEFTSTTYVHDLNYQHLFLCI